MLNKNSKESFCKQVSRFIVKLASILLDLPKSKSNGYAIAFFIITNKTNTYFRDIQN